MFNNVLTVQNHSINAQNYSRLTCIWIPTGNARMPLACVWAEIEAQSNRTETSVSSDNESRGRRLCA